METEAEVVLTLYVAGSGARSSKTIANLRRICEQHLDRHQLEVVDVRENPQRAEDEMVLMTPTLVRQSPGPQRRVVGDLSDTEAVLFGLDLSSSSRKGETPS
ncbi:MAG: circadian clock KaiB family protein [Vulcanimicrobiota bacterium]